MNKGILFIFAAVLSFSIGAINASTVTVEDDDEEFFQETIRRANSTNAPELQHQVGMTYFHRRDSESIEKAKMWLKKAADQNFPPSLHHLGVLLASGQDDSYAPPTLESHRLIERAADAGYALSQNYMGGVYRDGLMVEQDFEKAAYWYDLAAQQGNKYGLYNLGLFYQEGVGVEQDTITAVFLLMRSADEGLVDAEFDLAMLLRHSEDPILEGQLKLAADIFQELAEEGHHRAMFQYGYALAHGAGITRDEEGAVEWYKKAAQYKIPDAMNNLSVMYTAGRGVEASQKEAFSWAEKAAKLGHLDAQAKVAVFTMAGNGTEQDMEKGLAWMLVVDRRGDDVMHQFLVDSYGDDYLERLAELKPITDALYREFAEPYE